MPPEDKAKFGARDVTPPGYEPKGKKESKKYVGPERRRENRRSGQDRRTDVRFEPDKEDRRKNRGRRDDDSAPDFW